MILEKISHNVTLFRRYVILGIFIFLLVISSLFSGEWNNWLVGIFLVVLFPLAYYTILLLKSNEGGSVGRFDLRSPFLYGMVFIAIALGTSFFSFLKYASFHQFTLVLGYVVIFFVASVIGRSHRSAKVISLAIFFTGTLAALISCGQFMANPTARAGGLLYNPNALGGYLLFIVPLGLALTLGQQERKRRICLGLFTALVAVSFLLTFSYTGWASFIIPGLLTVLAFRKKVPLKKIVFISLAALVLVAAVTIGIRYASSGNFREAIAVQRVIPGSAASFSLTQRLEFARAAIHIFFDHPMTGTGLATFQNIYPRYAHTFLEQPRYVHNYYIQTLAELGIFGLLALVAFVGLVLVRAFRVIRRYGEDPAMYPYVVGLGMGLLGSAIHAFFDFGWQFPAVFYLFWLVGGIIIGLSQRQEAVTIAPSSQLHRWARPLQWSVLLLCLLLLVRGMALVLAQSTFDRAEAKFQQAAVADSIPLYHRATQLDPSPDKIRSYATALFDQGINNKQERTTDYARADQLLRTIIFWNKAEYFSYHQLGQNLFSEKEYAAAERNFRQAIYYDPIFHPYFYYSLAFQQYSQQQYEAVAQTLLPVIQQFNGILTTRHPQFVTDMAYANALLAESYRMQGKTAEARTYYLAALEYMPDLTIAIEGLAKLIPAN